MRITLLPPFERLTCPNAGCGGDLGPLDGPDGLFCEACASVVVILRDGTAIWHRRNAEPRTMSAAALRVPRA